MTKAFGIEEKIGTLSPSLQAKIKLGERAYKPNPSTPVSNWLVDNKRHYNGGRTVDSGLWLKQHCAKGGKLFVTLSGAASTAQIGVSLSELIQKGHVAAISATGANIEESMYRYVGNSHYAYIPDYTDLTPAEEKELDHAGFRRITDTFLPEEESVRIVLPQLEILWREAEAQGKPRFWDEFFTELFARKMVQPDPMANPDECWLYQAWLHGVPVFVPGPEDSTMGNIFAQACYDGSHEFLSQYKFPGGPISPDVVYHSFRYMHRLAEWYIDNTKVEKLAFVQLGGGIAADFPICVVPHLKKDYLADQSIKFQEDNVPTWAAFIEIHLTPMSAGSYSGAGWKEKITWGKFEPDAYGMQIFGDFTSIFPDIAALILEK